MNRLFLTLALGLAACGSAGPQAPMMKTVEKMDGALMVNWMNMETGCSAVDGERKLGAEAFTAVFSVPGEVDNKHDATATSDATYTYRVRCKKGDKYSAWSDEMGMNPVR